MVRTQWWLAVIVLSGFAIRMINIGAPPLWGDEALTLVISDFSLRDLFIRPVDPTPGLYYAVHKSVLPFGHDPWVHRIPLLVFGTLTIPATFVLGRNVGGTRVGLFTAACSAFAFPLIDYSQEARAYSLLVLLTTLSAAGACGIFGREKTERAGWTGLFWTAGILSIYTHPVGWFWFVPAVATVLLIRVHTKECSFMRAVFIGLATVLLVAPEARRLTQFAAVDAGGFDWNTQWSGAELFVRLGGLVLPSHLEPLGPVASPLMHFLFLLCLGALMLLTYSFWKARVGQTVSFSTMVLLSILASLPILLWTVGFLTTPVLLTRTMLPTIPAYFVLYGLLSRRLSLLGSTFCVALFLAESLFLLPIAHKDARSWPTVVTPLERQQDTDVLVICPENRGAAMLALRPDLSNFEKVLFVSDLGLVALQGPLTLDSFSEAVWKPLTPANREVNVIRKKTIAIRSLVMVDIYCSSPKSRPWERDMLGVVGIDADSNSHSRIIGHTVSRYEWDAPKALDYIVLGSKL